MRELTDREPAASPLGPFAVIDVLNGTAPELAARRQIAGYYEVARELAEERATNSLPPTASPEPVYVSVPALSPAPLTATPLPALKGKVPAPTVAEKIAPKKRVATEAPKRELPPPRGRFTRVDSQKHALADLFNPENRGLVRDLVEQQPHRYGIWRHLSTGYSGRAGSAVSMADVLDVLRQAEQLEELEKKERALLLATYAEHRGAAGRVGWAVGLNLPDLRKLEEALGLAREVDEVRERFRREALDARNFQGKLDLIGRSKYLADLGIEKRFKDSLRGELRTKLQACVEGTASLDDLYAAAGKRYAVPAELIGRTTERLGLVEDFRASFRDRQRSPRAIDD
ncbi:MAG: hypothetical protein ACT4TC_17000 [Myxococcaceae bacterium]